jgi:hypothetical protein
MSTSIWTRLTIVCLAACTVAALAAPASGQTLRRDGSKAAAFVAHVGQQADASSSATALRRDGSKAVPFVADVEPDSAAAAADGFHWGDAAIGAAVGVGLMMLASTAWIAANRRRRAGVLGRSSA